MSYTYDPSASVVPASHATSLATPYERYAAVAAAQPSSAYVYPHHQPFVPGVPLPLAYQPHPAMTYQPYPLQPNNANQTSGSSSTDGKTQEKNHRTPIHAAGEPDGALPYRLPDKLGVSLGFPSQAATIPPSASAPPRATSSPSAHRASRAGVSSSRTRRGGRRSTRSARASRRRSVCRAQASASSPCACVRPRRTALAASLRTGRTSRRWSSPPLRPRRGSRGRPPPQCPNPPALLRRRLRIRQHPLPPRHPHSSRLASNRAPTKRRRRPRRRQRRCRRRPAGAERGSRRRRCATGSAPARPPS